MILASSLLFSQAALFGQVLLLPVDIPKVAQFFEARPDDRPLRCEVVPIPPRLNFSFRFQTGYVFRVPMNQYFGPGHRWHILARVTPESGGPPAYLGSELRLPNVPKTNRTAEWGGFYWVGEGRYNVEWVLYDDSQRLCRKHWTSDAKLSPSERGMTLGIGSGTVAQISFRRWSPQDKADVPILRRITILLHAAPLFPRTTRFRAQDRLILLGSLASLLESLPARSVRLVIFNLDQQRELYHDDAFTPEAFDRAAQSMNNLQLQLVDYSILKNQRGHVDLLADLVQKELSATEPPDAVIFLGPATRYWDKVPTPNTDDPAGEAPRFFYFQYKPYVRATADSADSIERAVKRVHGKKLEIRTADEFAKAIRQVEGAVTPGK